MKKLLAGGLLLVALGGVVLLSLPTILHKAGLHPTYSGPTVSLPGKRALIITTSHDVLAAPGETEGEATGVMASELINDWLAQQEPEAGAAAVGRLGNLLGRAEFSVRGQTITALASPYRFYLLQRVHAIYAGLPLDEQASVEQMLQACGMQDMLAIKLDRMIGRADNLEVWQ